LETGYKILTRKFYKFIMPNKAENRQMTPVLDSVKHLVCNISSKWH